MAFTDLGDLGHANSAVSGTTVAMTTSQDAPAGSLVVVFSAWQPTDTADMDGLRHYVTDSAGNWYTYLGQWVNAGAAEAMIYASVIEHDLPAGGTITVTTVSARTQKAVTARLFSIGTSKFCLAKKAELTNDSADPGAVTVSGLPSRSYLLLHCLAAGGPPTDTYTWDSDYTQVAGDGASAMSVNGGFRIASLTSDTVDVTHVTAVRSYAQVLVAVREYEPTAAPATPLLDDFNRANENPLAAPWSKVDAGGLELLTNQVARTTTGLSRGAEQAGFGSDLECYVTIATKPTANAGNQIGVGAHFSSEGSTWNGYTVTVEPRSGVPDSIRVAYTTAGNLGSDITRPKLAYQYVAISAGDLIGLKTVGSVLECWLKTGGVWRMFAAIDDATARNGKLGMILGDTGSSGRLDDFHGAGYVSPGSGTHPFRVMLV